MKKVILFATALSAATAYANPTVYPSKAGVVQSVITNDKVTAQFIMDNHDDNLFYVLPPQRGFAYASDISVANANLGFCEDMVNIQNATHSITARLKDLEATQDSYQPAIDAAARRLGDAQAKLDAYSQSNTTAAQIGTIDASVLKNTTRLTTLYTLAGQCTTTCDAIQAEISSLQQENDKLAQSKQDLIDQNIDAANNLARYQAQVNSDQAALIQAQSQLDNVLTARGKLLDSLRTLYGTYAHLEGGTATLQYNSDWDTQVNLLKSLNPTKSFQAVNAYKVKLNAATLNSDDSAGVTIPAILSSVIDGRDNTNGDIVVDTYPEQMTASIRLSLAGACPITRPNDFHIDGIQAGKIKLGISASYTFDSAFATKIDCSYDQQELYTKVMNAGSSGFMFWKKNWQTIDIKDIRSTSFSCNWDGQQGAAMDFATRRKFESDALNLAIANTVSQYGTPQDISPTLPPVPTSGLGSVGDSLITMCGSISIYCQAGGWLMKSVDALFGSGQSTGSGSVTNQNIINMKWDENLMYPVQGQTNFNVDHV